MLDWIGDADRWVVERVQRLHDPPLDHLFRGLSALQPRLVLLAGLLVVVVVTARSVRTAVAAPLALAAGIAVDDTATGALKNVFDRPRPPLSDAAIHPLVATPSSWSMPSGHASSAFCAAVVLAAFAPRYRHVFFALAALIAVSRVWLGVHYPTDLWVGALLGLLIGWVAARGAREIVRLLPAGQAQGSSAP